MFDSIRSDNGSCCKTVRCSYHQNGVTVFFVAIHRVLGFIQKDRLNFLFHKLLMKIVQFTPGVAGKRLQTKLQKGNIILLSHFILLIKYFVFLLIISINNSGFMDESPHRKSLSPPIKVLSRSKITTDMIFILQKGYNWAFL